MQYTASCAAEGTPLAFRRCDTRYTALLMHLVKRVLLFLKIRYFILQPFLVRILPCGWACALNALHDLLICLLDTAMSRLEAVLVDFSLRWSCPTGGGYRRDFVYGNDLAVRSLAELELKVNGLTFRVSKYCFITSFTLKAIALMNSPDLPSRVAAFQCDKRGKRSWADSLSSIVLQENSMVGSSDTMPLFHARETLQRNRRKCYADDDLQRNNGDLLYQGLALGRALNKIRSAPAAELRQLEHMIAHYVC